MWGETVRAYIIKAYKHFFNKKINNKMSNKTNNKIWTICLFFFLGIMTATAQEKTEKIKVYGNCEMCKNRIEAAAKSAKGVSSASWHKETKTLTVTLNANETDIFKIAKYIAKAGHDTDLYKLQAKDTVYDKLPKCCQYTRTSKVFNTTEKTNSSGSHQSNDGHNHSH